MAGEEVGSAGSRVGCGVTEIEGLGMPLGSWLQDPLVTQIWRTELDTVAEATEDSESALVRLRSSEICKPFPGSSGASGPLPLVWPPCSVLRTSLGN